MDSLIETTAQFMSRSRNRMFCKRLTFCTLVITTFAFAIPSWGQGLPGNTGQPQSPFRPSLGTVNKSGLPSEDLNQRPTNLSANTTNSQGPTGQPANNGAAPQTQTAGPQAAQPGVTRVTKTLTTLPNSAGQVWREYDITPYTSQITTTKEPQKAVTDWILRETGTEMWFHQPLGVLNIDKNRLLVYHTPEIQAVVKGIVDRFNRTRGQVQNMDINLVTIEDPNWRAQLYTMLQPIEVKSPGIEAWMISKENAAILLSELRRRPDFKQHSGGRLANHDGQSLVLEKKRPKQFVRNLRWVPNQTPNYQPLVTKVDEGFRLEISSLSTMDNNTIEAVIKCDVDQIEKLSNVKVGVPDPNGKRQSMNLQIPQMVSWRMHERFRWPNDQVLLLSCGVVAAPGPQSANVGLKIPGLPQKSNRADALLFVEYRGPAHGAAVPHHTANTGLAPIRRQQ